ncbi:MAG: glycosyltransferase [Clostridia bacterium]|nr:glycosyltransferase [Clostridia bacterium]
MTESLNKKIDISVIVPVFNAEKYLNKCIESVIKQEKITFEIILVDDGSTDNSSKICDEYSNKYDCVKVIHKENGGVSSARNTGIKNASGKYCCFVDSDDFLLENALCNMYKAIEENNSCFLDTVLDRDIKTGNCKINNEKKLFLKYLISGVSYYPWAKLFKLDIIKDNEIYFDESMECSEDALYIREYLRYCDSMTIIDKMYYSYQINESGLSNKPHKEYALYFGKKLIALRKLLESKDYSKKEIEEFLSFRAIHGIRISIGHYVKCFSNSDDRERLISNAINLLLPYVKEKKIKNLGLKTWFFFNKKSIYKLNIKKLVKKEERQEKLKKLIKKIIKR